MVFGRTASGDGLRVDRGQVTGNELSDRDAATGLWPSDHAGVVLRLRGSRRARDGRRTDGGARRPTHHSDARTPPRTEFPRLGPLFPGSAGVAGVLEGAGGQPWRDRHPGLPGGLRAGRPHGGGVPLRGPLVRAPAEGRRGLRDRRARASGAGLPRRRRDRRGRDPGRRRRDLPGLRLPQREPPAGRGLRRRRHHLHRPGRRRPDPHRQQGARHRGGEGGRRSDAGQRRPVDGRRHAAGRRGGDDVPTVRQGRRRRRRPRHAQGRRAGACCARRSRPACARPRPPSATRRSSSSRPSSTRGTSRSRSWPTRPAPSSTSTSGTARCSGGTRRSSRSRPRPTSTPRCATASAPTPSRFATEIGYQNAGTVEFLLDRDGSYVFIEMNPRIQVEHTVTEEVTDVDLVQSQMRIASGETLDDLGLRQDGIVLRGAALQCRITTEDPANGFRPDTGRITTYRSPGGAGVRLDGGTTYTGAEVSAHFDSMLAKLTCRGRTFPIAVARARRAVAEFRIRGVSTNIAFLAGRAGGPRLRRRQRHHVVHRDPPAPADRPVVGRPRHQAAQLSRRRHRQPTARRRAGEHRPRHQAAPAGPARATHRTALASSCSSSGRSRSPGPCASSRPSPSPTPRSATRTSRCSPPGSARATSSPSPATSPAPRRSCGRSRRGAARRTTSPSASCPRTRGSGWPRCGRRCRTSACRCCCAGATPSATRPIPPRSPTPSSPRRPRPASTSSASSTPSTTSSRCVLPSTRSARPARGVAEVALCYTGDLSDPGEDLYTLDYYLGLAERIVARRRRRAGHQGHGRPAPRAGRAPPGHRAARELRPARPPAHPRHPRRPARHAARGDRRRGRRRRRGDRLHGGHDVASRRSPRWSPPPTTRTARPGSTSTPSARWSPTGRPPDGSTRRSSRGSRRRPAASTPTRSPAGSSPTSASRPSLSDSARSSSRSRTCTPPPTTSSATS